jgi:hypothetical protein
VISHNTTIYQDAVALLPGQFKDKTRILALLKAFMDEFQEVEDAMWDVFITRVLQNNLAQGDLLDKLGKIVGQPREGSSDADYSIFITARIRANRSNGLREDLLTIASLLVPSTTIYAKDFPPAAIYIEPLGPVTVSPTIIANQFLGVSVAAGVLLMFVWTEVPRANTILCGSVYAPSFSAGPPATNTGVLAGQVPGSVYNGGFTSGPPCTNTGGGVLPGVFQTES